MTDLPESAELSVESPGTGDHWQVGEPEGAVVTWSQVDAFGPVKIDLYKSNAFYASIKTGARVIDLAYIWTVPGSVEPDRGYQIYMESEWDSTLNDLGRAFEIVPYETESVLTVTTPASTDTWQNGVQDGALIRWDHSQLPGAIKIVLYKAAEPINVIADSINVSEARFTWTVPIEIAPGADYRIYLESLENQFVSGFSADFAILASDAPSTVEVSEPGGGGDRWRIGLVNAAVVEWVHSNLVGTVKIDLYQNDAFVLNIADSVDVAPGSYNWTVPLTIAEGSRYQIYIESNSLPFVNDLGGDFRIDPFTDEPILIVASPDRSTVWVQGRAGDALIAWNYANVTGTLRIDLYDGRYLYSTIADNVEIDTASYVWTVPDSIPLGSRYNIVLTSNELPTLVGFGDNFNIKDLAAAAVLDVTKPVSGDYWLLGAEDAEIQWYSEYLEGSVQIDLYDNRTLYATIADSVDVTLGTYTWLVPDDMPTGSQYNLVLTSHELATIEGQSANFDILDLASVAVLELYDPSAGDIWIVGEVDGAIVDWHSEYLTGTVRIELYRQNTLITTLVDSADIAPGRWTGSVPNSIPASIRYNVRLISNQLPEIEAQGDNFNILVPIPMLAVTRPSDTDIWIANEADGAVIEWYSQYITGTIDIELYEGTISNQDVSTRNYIAVIGNAVSVLDDSYLWTVPESLPTGSYSILLASNDLPDIIGTGLNFTISDSASAATLTLVHPVDGDVWTAGGSESVEWTSEYLVGTLKIELYANQKLEAVISSSVDVSLGSYLWPVPPGLDGSNYNVRVQSNELPSLGVVRGDNFVIQ
ncbi:MAG: Ser-Thr-rich GPI-anchored membrane family protein [Candidatus Neomarinimicrobiota bacterium]